MRYLVLAARTLRKNPVFTLTAAVTIALGIGASTAIFSVTNSVLLRSLPYRNPDRLMVLYGDLQRRNDTGSPFSTENFIDIRDGSKGTFEDMGAVFTGRQVLPREDGTPEQVRFAIVTTNFFRLMGAKIDLGRDFEDADGAPQPQPAQAPAGAAAPGPPPLPAMIILSYEFFQRRYGGKPEIIGHTLTSGARGQQVVGVLAPGFELLFPPRDNMEARPDFWIANRLAFNNANRNSYWLRPIGRLKPGVSVDRAQAEVESAVAQIRKSFTLYATAGFHARVEPMHKALVAQVRPAILALMGAVIFLLLIACANVANLLLVRTSLRERELVVRAALGAGWWRLAGQMLSEAVLLTGFGAALGIGLAWFGIHELLAIAPANLPRLETIRIDPVVLAFTAVTALIAAILFGMTPAWGALRLDLMHVLRGSGRTAGLGAGGVLRNLVVVAQVALCFVLLIGSGLMFRSFLELQRIDPGFDAHGLLTFQLLGGRNGTAVQRVAYARQLESRLKAIPGVEAVTASYPFPLTGNFSTIRWGLAEALADNSKYQAVDWQKVLPGYFETLRTQLIDGRTFTEADNDPARNVVLIDQFLAAKAFPHGRAVGQRILTRLRTPEPEWVEVIGVVAHQRDTSLADPGREQVYFTDAFGGPGGSRIWAVRTAGDPAGLASRVRAEVLREDPQYLVSNMEPMDTIVWHAQAATRFSLMLIGVFAIIAALLVAVGLYGVLSTVVRQRTAEIGVRVAFGAAPGKILRMVVGHGLRVSGAGIAVGLIAAIGLTRVMTTMLVGVKPTDPLTFVVMAAIFFLIAAVSSWVPARRAAALDPTVALREE
ncbi:MAG TPA: ABC transporter permease [Bryobacteraceae bacterium]